MLYVSLRFGARFPSASALPHIQLHNYLKISFDSTFSNGEAINGSKKIATKQVGA